MTVAAAAPSAAFAVAIVTPRSSSWWLSTLCVVSSLLFSHWWTLWELAKFVCRHKLKQKKNIPPNGMKTRWTLKFTHRSRSKSFFIIIIMIRGAWWRRRCGCHGNVAKIAAVHSFIRVLSRALSHKSMRTVSASAPRIKLRRNWTRFGWEIPWKLWRSWRYIFAWLRA